VGKAEKKRGHASKKKAIDAGKQHNAGVPKSRQMIRNGQYTQKKKGQVRERDDKK